MKPVEAAKSILRNLENNQTRNETSRRELFIGHLGYLFPEYAWQISEYAVGAEQKVKFTPKTGKRTVTGRIDTRKGSLIIEYKTHVKTQDDQKETEEQLKEYISGSMNKDGIESISKCVSTDIVNWHEYGVELNPEHTKGKIKPDDIILTDKRSYSFSSSNPEKFVEIVKQLVFDSVPLVATSQILITSFGLKSDVYSELRDKLEAAWNDVKNESESKLALRLWSEYVENCFVKGVKPDESTYLDHIYLLIISRLIAGAAIADLEDLADEEFPKRCITGEFFSSGVHRVEHFVEEDFFRWMMRDDVHDKIESAIASVHTRLQRLDFRSAQKMNLLQELYQQIMPPEHKTEYGEVFTPSWLVEDIVDSIPQCRKIGTKVLDPACGTGSFLRCVIQKKRAELPKNSSAQDILDKILADVVGLDINPISVVIAKTSIMLSLADLLRESDEPIRLPIYFCDSLFLPKTVAGMKGDLVVAFDGSEIKLPAKLFHEGTTEFDELVNTSSSIARDLVGGALSASDVKSRVEDMIKRLTEKLELDDKETKTLSKGIRKLIEDLEKRIRSKRNNVWAFVLKNTYRPSLLKATFGVVLSNPPWLAMSSFPSARYKSQLTELIEFYQLTPEGSSKHHMEVATLFALHSVAHYLKDQGNFAFVLPRGILNGDHHDPFRQSSFQKTSPMSVDSIWDMEKVESLFDLSACVLFGKSDSKNSGMPSKLPRVTYYGKTSSRIEKKKDSPLILLKHDTKSYFGTTAIDLKTPTKNYEPHFRQGADLMPRTAVIVDIVGNRRARILSIQTSHREKSNPNADPQLKNLNFRGTIEKDYVFTTLKSDGLLPFITGEPSTTALPIRKKDTKWSLMEPKDFASLGHSNAKNWFAKIDRKLVTVKGKQLASWLKRRNKLINQSSIPSKHMVLYGAGGTNIAAAVLDSGSFDFPFVNDQTLYAYEAKSAAEAWYVCGMLNSTVVNESIKEMQARGKFKERHIHKLPLRVIPMFDPTNQKHVKISDEARAAGRAAKRLSSDSRYLNVSKSLASRRRMFGDALIGDLAKLNKLVSELLRN